MWSLWGEELCPPLSRTCRCHLPTPGLPFSHFPLHRLFLWACPSHPLVSRHHLLMEHSAQAFLLWAACTGQRGCMDMYSPLPQRPQIFCFVSLISPSLNDLICFPWCQRPFLFYVPRASMDWTCAIAIWTVSLVNEWVESEPRNMLTGNLVRPRGSLVVKESARRGHICWGEHGGSTWIWP